ncbi:hypothetical protein IE53DRAFT_370838 [Violaceomyces palustris]|uniref:Uncharacterized protein n=1 Tax=Violaceomyces palustris TaxID=1673888 RepID=A0ACD0NQV8_9BASI|nr:hypothetical protein IE53DRAFT_370838 [Violaceomyces palustris]
MQSKHAEGQEPSKSKAEVPVSSSESFALAMTDIPSGRDSGQVGDSVMVEQPLPRAATQTESCPSHPPPTGSKQPKSNAQASKLFRQRRKEREQLLRESVTSLTARNAELEALLSQHGIQTRPLTPNAASMAQGQLSTANLKKHLSELARPSIPSGSGSVGPCELVGRAHGNLAITPKFERLSKWLSHGKPALNPSQVSGSESGLTAPNTEGENVLGSTSGTTLPQDSLPATDYSREQSGINTPSESMKSGAKAAWEPSPWGPGFSTKESDYNASDCINTVGSSSTPLSNRGAANKTGIDDSESNYEQQHSCARGLSSRWLPRARLPQNGTRSGYGRRLPRIELRVMANLMPLMLTCIDSSAWQRGSQRLLPSNAGASSTPVAPGSTTCF